MVKPIGQLAPELTAEENLVLPLLLGGTRRTPAIEQARKWSGRLGLPASARAVRPVQVEQVGYA